MYFLPVQKVPAVHGCFYSLSLRYACANDKTAQKIHKLSFSKESLIKEKFQLHVVQKLRLFPIKSTSLTDKKQIVSNSLLEWQFSPQIKVQFQVVFITLKLSSYKTWES